MFRHLPLVLSLCTLLCPVGWAQTASKTETAPAAQPARTEGGLAGAAAMRNENVQVNLIDNDSIKEANIRLGDNVTVLPEIPVEVNGFASEHGRPLAEGIAPRPASPLSGWHGELFEYLQNSVFNARRFFQAGPVLPSRQNRYGFRFGGRVSWLGDLTGDFTGRKTRGMVNGNVLVPLATERTPRTADPALAALISRFLAAYPNQLPNRLDFDPRALNTNSPQAIDQIDASLRLDRKLWGGRLTALETLSRQNIDAFELVAGQNPDTALHGHRSRLGWQKALTPATAVLLGAQFTRLRSSLLPEPNAVGPRVRFGYQIEELGPDSQFPINRAENTFRAGSVFTHQAAAARHILTFGGDLTRAQVNGSETSNGRGVFWFNTNFGRSAIENLLQGTPSLYEVTVGEMARGFRTWASNVFLSDKWNVAPRFQITYGLRYNLAGAPVEVNGRNTAGYGCDCNNFSPRFSIAWRAPAGWVLRSGYTVSFAGIPSVTYGQVRYNPPGAHYLQVTNPSLLAPLAGINLADPNIRTSPTILADNLVSPYTHQYALSLERRLGQSMLRVGYTGSRTFKLLDASVQNRALPVPGIPLTTATVDQRRADPRYYDVKYILNGGAAYLDAAQVSYDFRGRRGFQWNATYTFGKALDTGADYSGTAANNDLIKGRPQSQFDSAKDRKGLSTFDSTHSLTMFATYDLPRPHANGLWMRVAGGWQVSGSVLAKTGTPLTLFIGSDSPGYGNVDGGGGDRPNLLDPSILGKTIGDPDTAPQILRRDRFAYIVPGEVSGNLGHGTFRKGGIFNANAALSRQWHFGLSGDRAFLFRAEAFNLTNHPQFDEPQRNLSSPAFGKITNTLNDGRVLQLGIRVQL